MKRSHAYKGYVSAYKVEILKPFNRELLKDTESAITNKLKDLLTEMKGFKLVTRLALEFKQIEIHDETKYSTFYLPSKAETIHNNSDIDDVFESIYIKHAKIAWKGFGLDY